MRDLSDFDILSLPGTHSSGPDHWQTHWEAVFPNMRRVEQEDWDVPVYDDWSRRLTEAVDRCRRPVLLVAHSLGTALVARWAQEANSRTVAGAFLVATSDVDRLAATPGYRMRGFAPAITKRLPFPTMVLASRNDDRVTFERARAFASAWGSSFVDVGALGHIGSAAQLGLWPQGLVWLGQFIASVS
ncbi:TPA: RBBP9/YdeN family alpha/beta hydrolase [Burkholderia contaminans]|uniref:RBBP9/YdeN family alpha/beta hydrolase n=1 Tax=Burkholderia TaxID=32008 RepID=UPI0009C031E2|nr:MULTISPECIES: alpha/beta fold hydrolase [Burkholderia]MBM6431223.1 alpha/beta hydrolase [Burkholderia contaminans]MBR8015791.1 alpha/beta hydrolase [Burkholderia vietnamiensis]MCB4349035.1 alpha/beta fold hydrolase [Burkholderia vietnamiensis]MDN8026276.1 alpha/beta fold hydrolase [Burkholderia contaminans]PRF99249.1 serine hydrolase family protein [Burkholderia contaminans]